MDKINTRCGQISKEARAATLINEALDEIDAGAQPVEGYAFFASLPDNLTAREEYAVDKADL